MTPLPYTIPSLYCPAAPPRHPQADEIKQRVDAQFAEYGLREIPEYAAAYDSMEMSELFVRCHPVGEMSALLAIAPFFFLAGLDDKPQSATDAAQQPPGISSLIGASAEDVIALMASPDVQRLVTDPLAAAFLQAGRHFADVATPDKLRLVVTRFMEWVTVERRLTEQEASGYRPGITEAIHDRMTSVALPLIEAFTAGAFPGLTHRQVVQAPASEFWQLIALAAAAHNDLISGYVEHDVAGNLVNTFAREPGTTWQEAADRVADLADRALAEAQRCLDTLVVSSADPELLDHLTTALAHPIVAIRWFYPRQMTRRYRTTSLDLTRAIPPLTDEPQNIGPPGIDIIDHLWHPETGL
ncbi:terpene synthase family protein [Streptomyces sp. NPDC037389]|uniref:terpene synthase family protein n=1 Tax=Streptomyces sp. NPDC037389 TaxID=3155369 RepID=UPI00340E2A3A